MTSLGVRGGRPSRGTAAAASRNNVAGGPHHRIATVRIEQGISLRTAARQMGLSIREVRRQENPATDLSLSELFRWQRLLDVPVEDLLLDPQASLSRPVMARAQLVRLMKTASAMLEQSESPGLRRMIETMIEQLVEIMPELEKINAWHSVGQRRRLDEYGRAADRQLSDAVFTDQPID